MPITPLDYDPTDPRLQVQYTRQELAALCGKDLSTIKKWILVHTIVEEQLPGDGRGTKVIRLAELVSRGLYHLDALPAEPGDKPAHQRRRPHSQGKQRYASWRSSR